MSNSRVDFLRSDTALDDPARDWIMVKLDREPANPDQRVRQMAASGNTLMFAVCEGRTDLRRENLSLPAVGRQVAGAPDRDAARNIRRHCNGRLGRQRRGRVSHYRGLD